MRRDTRQLRQNDTFAVILDTFYDRRNAVAFYTNPLGAIADFQITNEGNPNSDWNPVWDVRTGRFEGGWTVEMEIPFKSLRYRPGPSQIWGVQLRRNVRRKNEWNYITPLPISAGSGPGGIFRVSDAATLVGLDAPSGSKNLEVKPYGIGGISTNLAASPQIRNAGDGNGGLDVKYGVTQNLTADFTVNTDFAQVEVDEQQVNLTRFNLFFPEKREFFLEGRGIFDFARGGFSGGFGGALRRTGGGFFGGGNAPTIFYSRRIGLQNGTVVPIVGGGRLTGKIGAFDVGALNIQTDDEVLADAEMTNFTVVRLKRDILRRSSLGAIFTNRSLSLVGDGSSQSYGADATFSFYENVSLLGYAARTQVPDPARRGDDLSYQGRFDYGGDRYGFQAEHLLVEKNFIPEVGFLRRDNFRRSYAQGAVQPAAAVAGQHPPVPARRQLRLHRDRRSGNRGDPAVATRVLDRAREQRPVRRVGGGELRVPPPRVHPGAGRRGLPGRRLQLLRRRGHLVARHPAPPERDLRGAGRRLLRRQHPHGRLPPRAHGGDPAALAGAQRLGQLDRLPARVVPHGPRRLARELDLHAADVLQRVDSVQLEQRTRSATTCGCAGSTRPAASCSSSTPRIAKPIPCARTGSRSCATAASWSR